jgi:hypothetical protein
MLVKVTFTKLKKSFVNETCYLRFKKCPVVSGHY